MTALVTTSTMPLVPVSASRDGALHLLSTPLSLGTLDAYIQAANRIPMLTQEEELRLAQTYRNEHSAETERIQAAQRMILSHLRLVVSVARQYMGYGLPHADLIQEGNIGLMKAVKRFDPSHGVRLMSYALHWIKAEIHEYILKNWRMVKLATTKAQRKLFFNLRSHKQGLQSFTPEQIDTLAKELNVKREEVMEMETRLGGGDVALESQLDDGEESYAPIAWLSDSHHEPTQVLAARQKDRVESEGLESALSQLDARSRRIIEARWLTVNDDGSGGKTLHDLAAEFGVSAERIRQIEVAAMKKMKGALASFQ